MRVLSLAIGLLALVCVDLTLADGTGDSQQNVTRKLKTEDWVHLYDELFTKTGPYLESKVVFEILKKMQKVYEPFSDEDTIGRKTMVNELLEASVMDPKKCKDTSLLAYVELIDDYSRYRRTIVPYLKKHFINLLNICNDPALEKNPLIDQHSHHRRTIKPYLTNHFIDLLNKCDNPAFEKSYSKIKKYEGVMHKLEDHIDIVRASPDRPSSFDARVSLGLLSYLEAESGAKLVGPVASNDTEKVLKAVELFRDMIHVCGKWVRGTDPLGLLEKYGDRFKINRPELVTRYIRNCKFIREEESQLYEEFFGKFEEMIKKGKDKHKGNKLLGLLRMGKPRDNTSN